MSPYSLNILTSHWIPVRMPDGSVQKRSVRNIAMSPAVAVAHPRADFSALITELLVALYQTLAAPADEKEQAVLRAGGAPDLTKFSELEASFEVFSEGNRFFQSPEAPDGEIPSSSLVFEAPGEKTRKENKDFYVDREQFQAICPHCAPALLMLNQAHARSGGSGYRPSVRGGSSMTALLKGRTLWHTITLNLLTSADYATRYGFEGGAPDVFPWTAGMEAFTSETATANHIGLYASLWWMPLAMRLSLRPNPNKKACDLCGEVHDELLGETVRRGANKAPKPIGLVHPYTAWYENTKQKPGDPSHLPELVPGDSHLLKEWVSLSLGATQSNTQLAALRTFKVRPAGLTLWTFGPRCDKVSFLRWHDESMPVLSHPELTADELRDVASKLLTEARRQEQLLGKALRHSGSLLTAQPAVMSQFVLACRTAILDTVQQVDVESGALPLAAFTAFHQGLARSATSLFDHAVPMDPSAPTAMVQALKNRQALVSSLKKAA